jgi:hypothetical protein
MADIIRKNSTPSRTRPGRFFTMVSMDEGKNSTTANENVVTDLIIPALSDSGATSTYLPSAAGSAYAAGMINSLISAQDQAQSGWISTVPLVNNAKVNQDRFLASMGSVTINFNLSQNMRILRGQVRNQIPTETSQREVITMSKELEQAICTAAVTSATKSDFLSGMQTQFAAMETYTSKLVLGKVYDDLQNIHALWNYGSDSDQGELDWESIANGTSSEMLSPSENFPGNDVATSSHLVATNLLPSDTSVDEPGSDSSNTSANNPGTNASFVLYEERSPTIRNAVLVNNLVMVGGTAPSGY